MDKLITVSTCYHVCPMFRTGMEGMYCGHPYFEYLDVYDSCIIHHDNSKGRVPDECPLRVEPLVTTVELTDRRDATGVS